MPKPQLRTPYAIVFTGVTILLVAGVAFGFRPDIKAVSQPAPPTPSIDPLKDAPLQENIYVEYVTDGDTFRVALYRGGALPPEESLKSDGFDIFDIESVEVKLAGIDAYEYAGSPGHDVGDCAGTESLAELTILLQAGQNASDGYKRVNLVRDPLQPDRDSIGRLVRYVYLPDGTDVNLDLIRRGYATNWSGTHSRAAEFAEAEKNALNSEAAKMFRDQCAQNPRRPVDPSTGWRNDASRAGPIPG